jgi:hypothetical protein
MVSILLASGKPRILSETGPYATFKAVACYNCPWLENYDLIWKDEADPRVICVMLWCCAGPELQIRRGEELLLDEYYATKALVYERAEQLRREGFTAQSPTAGKPESRPESA